MEKDFENTEEELFNLSNITKYKQFEIINNINFFISKNGVNDCIIKENLLNYRDQQLNQNNSNENKNKNKFYGNNLDNTTKNGLITEELLTKDFIHYSKETIILSDSIHEKELKIDKIYSFIQKFLRFLKILKKGAHFFNKSIILFN